MLMRELVHRSMNLLAVGIAFSAEIGLTKKRSGLEGDRKRPL